MLANSSGDSGFALSTLDSISGGGLGILRGSEAWGYVWWQLEVSLGSDPSCYVEVVGRRRIVASGTLFTTETNDNEVGTSIEDKRHTRDNFTPRKNLC
jgi:hypothetical protein